MLKLLTCLGIGVAMSALSQVATAADMPVEPLKPVPFTAVKFSDPLWAPRIETNRTVVVPHNIKMCESTGRIDNFAKAGGLMPGEFRGIFYDDSDLYKAIEGACYTLATHPDPELDKYLDGVIAKIAAAQQPNGYLFTYYTLKEKDKRWTNLKDMHELYCAGHLIEAAVAHHQATGKKTLLNVAIKLADHIDSLFGPEPNKRKEICGHEEIELALVRLYHLTGEKRYLSLAKFFIDLRGTDAGGQRKKWGEYYQDRAPLAQQDRPVGHAVRAMYFYTGAADVAAATRDGSYLAPLSRLWSNTIERKMYITGGVGARHAGEAFGDDYELPNETAYCETCAAIGNALWNSRMNRLHADARYADVVERVLYNGMLSGVSLAGDKFFYVNPLASRGRHHRKEWYGTACCPSNVARFLPSIPGYVYATGENAIYVNLYAAGKADVTLSERKVTLTQETRYPWEGQIKLIVNPAQEGAFKLHLRLPEWAKNITFSVNGKAFANPPVERGYAVISREWKAGDMVEIDIPMPIERVYAHPEVRANRGRVALQRGPVVYCVEAVDNGNRVYHLSLPKEAALKHEHRKDLLGGVTVLMGKALAHSRENPNGQSVDLLAVPYYAWDHRAAGQMMVWIPEDPKLAQAQQAPTIASDAKPSASHCFENDTVDALNDQLEPEHSNDQSIPRFTWWPRRGSEEWAQLSFSTPQKVSEVELYWFDDGPGGGCRVPASWKLLYKDGEQWKAVNATVELGVKKDQFNKVTFAPVQTMALRVVVQLQPEMSSGIMEWRAK